MSARMEAAWWEPAQHDAVRCGLCPLRCLVRDGRDGPCGTRGNRGGRMLALQYAEVAALAVDPIEKKPLFHFHPGEPILSLAASGCNLHCAFCQNWTLSQEHGRGARHVSPDEAVALARAERSFALAYTYSEPLVWFEYVRDTAKAAHEAGLKNVVVTNGFLEPGPLDELIPLLDAANVDLKSMDDAFYRKVCKARLEPVLASIRRLHAAGVHLEITNLVIPGHNDADDQLRAVVAFVASLGRSVPLHFSAYHPAWKLDAPPTPPETLARAARIGRERLDFVYVGNARVPGGADTVCPGCGRTAVRRDGFGGTVIDLDPAGRCTGCGCGIAVRG